MDQEKRGRRPTLDPLSHVRPTLTLFFGGGIPPKIAFKTQPKFWARLRRRRRGCGGPRGLGVTAGVRARGVARIQFFAPMCASERAENEGD